MSRPHKIWSAFNVVRFLDPINGSILFIRCQQCCTTQKRKLLIGMKDENKTAAAMATETQIKMQVATRTESSKCAWWRLWTQAIVTSLTPFLQEHWDNDIKHFVRMKNCSFSLDTFWKHLSLIPSEAWWRRIEWLQTFPLNRIFSLIFLCFFSISLYIRHFYLWLRVIMDSIRFVICCLYRNKCNALCSIDLT